VFCGHRFEKKEKAGIATLLASMMQEGTEKRSAEEIDNELDKLGSSINFFPGANDITVNVFSLTKNLDATLAILQEMMFLPRFAQEDFDRLKNEQIKLIENQSTQAGTMANNAYNRLLFDQESVMSLPAIGTTASVNSITLDDVKNYYKNFWSSNVTNAVVVSNLEYPGIMNKLGFLKNWESKKVVMPAESKFVNIDKTRIYLVNKDKAAQSEIRIGYMALAYDANGDFYKCGIMNYPLGGAFNSRINLNLREDKGYTYGARSGYNGSMYKGTFTAAAGVRGNATDSSVVEFMKELKKFREKGITEEELQFTRNAMMQSEALKYESNFQKAGFLRRILDYYLGDNFTDEQTNILKNITAKEINFLAAKYLPTDNMIITIVGDREKVAPGLRALGYEVVDVDSDGTILPSKK
jgi:zinc protease